MTGRAMNLKELLARSAAFVTFTGLGAFDVFVICPTGARRYVGALVLDQRRPPFKQGNAEGFEYAPGYVLFARGL